MNVITACGLLIPTGEIGQATAVREPCRRCWPEEFVEAHEVES